jgi:hypothetical protein
VNQNHKSTEFFKMRIESSFLLMGCHPKSEEEPNLLKRNHVSHHGKADDEDYPQSDSGVSDAYIPKS